MGISTGSLRTMGAPGLKCAHPYERIELGLPQGVPSELGSACPARASGVRWDLLRGTALLSTGQS